MRRAARVDANHAEIVAALRAAGCSVQSLAGVGDSVPDLLVGVRDCNYLLEVKRPELLDHAPTNKRERDRIAAQQTWRMNWRGGPCFVVYSADDALRKLRLRA